MSSLPQLVLPITAGFAVLGLLLLALLTRRSKRAGAGNQVIEFECSSCQKTLIIHPGEMTAISPAEVALVVSVRPHVVGRTLGEYRCPYCDADHCFVTEGWPPEYVTSNAYESQNITAHCTQCEKPLQKPGWAAGNADENVLANPGLGDHHGLVCSRCHRGPVEKVFRF